LDIENKIKLRMTDERFKHALETARLCDILSDSYPINSEKLRLTALSHDIAKDIPKEEMERLIDKYGVVLDEIEKKEKGLWHGPVGALILREEFDIDDQEILDAVKFHSTGKENMSLYGKLIYIADFLETWPDKEFEDIARVDLDACLKIIAGKKISYVLKKGSLLHPRTVSLWNNLCIRKR